MEDQIDELRIDKVLKQAIPDSIKPNRVMRRSKKYWNEELDTLLLQAVKVKKYSKHEAR